jgi:hypothetical protein
MSQKPTYDELEAKVRALEAEKECIFTSVLKYHFQLAYNELNNLEHNIELPADVWNHIKTKESDWNIELGPNIDDIKAFLEAYCL